MMEEGRVKLGGNKPITNTPRPPINLAGRRNADVANNRSKNMAGGNYGGINVGVVRSEQWEHTAFGWGIRAAAYGETEAVNNLFAKRIKQLESALKKVEDRSIDDDYCYVCEEHPSSGHSPDCVFYSKDEK